MPTYDYVCDQCGHTFEMRQSFHDAPCTVCPVCGGPVRRVFSPSPIIFKGSGWYATDSKRASPTATAGKTESKATDKAEGATSSGGGGGADGSTSAGGAEKPATEAAPKKDAAKSNSGGSSGTPPAGSA